MGLLDDAIREHLDLKRRHGADPGEVARQEHEALGPVRREPAPAVAAAEHPHAVAPGDQHEGPHGDPLSGPAHEPTPGDEPTSAADAGDADSESAHEPTSAADARDADRAGGAGEDDSASLLAERLTPRQDPPAAAPEPEPDPPAARTEPEPEPEPEDPRQSDIVHQPTTEFRVEDHHDDEPAQPPVDRPAEDMLEETPEFLQETPEHDRLWFEQRPPRDFDFDG